jgi:hypothetical protein
MAVLTIRVLVVLLLEAPRRGSQEPRRVLSQVSRLSHNQHPSVPWVQDPDTFEP